MDDNQLRKKPHHFLLGQSGQAWLTGLAGCTHLALASAASQASCRCGGSDCCRAQAGEDGHCCIGGQGARLNDAPSCRRDER